VHRTYCLEFVLEKPATVRIGKLGTFVFQAGYYIYVGSARKNMQQRIARHLRIAKKQFWHIDYLRPYADIKAVWRSTLSEQHIVALLARDFESPVAKFGASDTNKVSHLFFSRKTAALFCYPLSLLTRPRKRV
jgi:Uri superfamily endonuclease